MSDYKKYHVDGKVSFDVSFIINAKSVEELEDYIFSAGKKSERFFLKWLKDNGSDEFDIDEIYETDDDEEIDIDLEEK